MSANPSKISLGITDRTQSIRQQESQMQAVLLSQRLRKKATFEEPFESQEKLATKRSSKSKTKKGEGKFYFKSLEDSKAFRNQSKEVRA